VRDVPDDPDDVAIVQAIVAMAHRLRLEVVAEGVETPEQRAFLEDCGCDEIQGYLLGPPLPAEHFPALGDLSPNACEARRLRDPSPIGDACIK